MFRHFKTLFAPNAPDPHAAEREARRAAAALLVEASLADGACDPAELEVIDAALGRLYGLDAAAARALRAEAEQAVAVAVDSYRFTSAVKGAMTVAQRIDLLTELWRVVLADGRRDDAEEAFMRRLAGLLYVPDQESALARARAETPPEASPETPRTDG